MEHEEWRDIPGYVGIYEVSNLGSVRALARLDSRGRKRRARPRALSVQSSGHRTITLSKVAVRRTFQVSHLVLMAFVGPRPIGMEACHWNDDPSDNRLSNLRWDHSQRQPTRQRAEQHPPRS